MRFCLLSECVVKGHLFVDIKGHVRCFKLYLRGSLDHEIILSPPHPNVHSCQFVIRLRRNAPSSYIWSRKDPIDNPRTSFSVKAKATWLIAHEEHKIKALSFAGQKPQNPLQTTDKVLTQQHLQQTRQWAKDPATAVKSPFLSRVSQSTR